MFEDTMLEGTWFTFGTKCPQTNLQLFSTEQISHFAQLSLTPGEGDTLGERFRL